MSESIDTGDVVYHRPTREEWVVAIVEGDRLYWCGWPPGSANLSDCELRKKAEPGEALVLLAQLAEMQPDDGGYDARKSLALARLQAMKNGAPSR